MSTVFAIAFWAAVAIAFELWGPKLADKTGWKWPRSKWRGLIGAGLVYLALLPFVAAFVVVGGLIYGW